MAELWDLYNIQRKPLGRTHRRGEAIKQGEYHIVVQICVLDARGRLLMTKRHPQKVLGGMWKVTAGSVLAGEDSVTGAIRELREETGLMVEKEQMKPLYARIGSDFFFDCYIVRLNADGDEMKLSMQEGETTGYIWADIDTQERMEREGQLVPIAKEARKYLG